MEEVLKNQAVDYSHPILTVQDLVVKFNLRGQVLTALRGINLELYKGESLAIVGESGSGKSVFCKTFMGLLDNNGWIDKGAIHYGGYDLTSFKKEKEWIKIRGKRIAMVFQDPMTSLNPLKTIGKQIQEAFTLHNKVSKEDAKKRTLELLADVGIEDAERRYKQYPHEFSGGMRQRVMIAMALACEPKLLIADEPTTALDVTIQAQILELMVELKKKINMSVIIITHDLGVVSDVCDRIAVMYAGKIVEIGSTDDIFYNPQHCYTLGLLKSIPKIHEDEHERLIPIEGTPVDLLNPPAGCPFASRCDKCMKICLREMPPYTEISEGHVSACWLIQKRQMEEAKAEGGKEA